MMTELREADSEAIALRLREELARRRISRQALADMARLTLRAPLPLLRFVPPKGSVVLDGVSLTINEVKDDTFSVLIIPHTLEVTTFGAIKVGEAVNLEVDMMARYVARLMETR